MRTTIGVAPDYARSASYGQRTDRVRRIVCIGIVVNLKTMRASRAAAVRAVESLRATQKCIVTNNDPRPGIGINSILGLIVSSVIKGVVLDVNGFIRAKSERARPWGEPAVRAYRRTLNGNRLLAAGARNHEIVVVDQAEDTHWINAASASGREVQLAMVKAEPYFVPTTASPSAKLNHAVSVRNAFDKLQTSHTDEVRR